jgi:aspartate aminotransferase
MMSISNKAKNITPSLTLAINAKANKMKSEGINVISFGAGEPDFNTPAYIVAAAKEALDKGLTKYTPSGGTAALKAAICDKFKKENDLTYTPSQIVVSNGAKHSLYNALQAIVNDGDEVIIPSPYWLTYPEIVRLSGATPVFVKTQECDGFKMMPDSLKKAITKKTKAIIINSPSNPTGAVYSRAELYGLAEIIEKTDIYIISDEIYEKLIYGGAEHISIASYSPKIFNQTVTVNGFSKAYAMTGWRVGYLGANQSVAGAIDAIQSHETSNVNSIAQYAAATALNGAEGDAFLKTLVKTFDERRKLMTGRIGKMSTVSCTEPSGAFYVMLNVGGLVGKSYRQTVITDVNLLCSLMLNARIAAVPGDVFGAPVHLRLSYAIGLNDIEEGLNRLEDFLNEIE